MSKTDQEVQTGLDHEETQGQGGASRVDAAGGIFTDQRGSGKWVLENDPDEYIEGGETPTPPAISAAPPPAAPAAPASTVPDGGFQVATRTGLVFRGKDANEVLQRALDAIDKQALNVVQHRSEIANLKRQLGEGGRVDRKGYAQQPVAASASAGAPTASSSPSGFDDTQFYNEFAKNPRAAMEMWAKDYFGMENPRDALHRSYDVSTQVSDRIEIADFLAQNQDFPQTTEASQMMLSRLEEDGAALTSWNMKVAFDKLVAEGMMQKVSAQGGRGEETRQYEQPPTPAAPAPPSRGAGVPPAPANSAGTPASTNSDRAPTLEEFDSWEWKKQQKWLMDHGMYHGNG